MTKHHYKPTRVVKIKKPSGSEGGGRLGSVDSRQGCETGKPSWKIV